MITPIEMAHQTIRAGAGYAAAAASAGLSPARLAEILHGRAAPTPHEAARLGAVTGLGLALAGADADTQLLTNRNAAL